MPFVQLQGNSGVRNNHSFSPRYLALNTREKVKFVLVYILLHCERALVVVVTL